ncbi:transporter associated domain-containing protein, partial [Halorubrum distributum]
AGHTRYPVVENDDADRVVGFVDVKDVLRATETGDDGATASDLAREILVVPETTSASDLLVQFRDERRQMAAVIDEWGAFEGIATVEDVAEALVGDLRDEFDVADGRHTIRRTGDRTHEADGSVALLDVNDALGTDLSGDGYETLGGFVLDRIGRSPEVGDVAETEAYAFEVTAVDGARISTVRVTRRDDPSESADDGDGEGSPNGDAA